MSRRPGRAKRVPRAPPSGTVVCWEFLLFCVKRLKNEKKNRFVFKIFRFSGSAITYYKCLRGFFFNVFLGVKPPSERQMSTARVTIWYCSSVEIFAFLRKTPQK